MPDAGSGPDLGHNSAVDVGQLNAFINRVERLEEEKKEVSDQIKEVFDEAREAGFCPATMKSIVKLRRKSASDRQHDLFMLDLYVDALGMRAGSGGGEVRSALDELHKLAAEDGCEISLHAGGRSTKL